MTLTSLPTRHDLPPRWDGCAVLWDDWAEHATSLEFHTHIRDRACQRCGSIKRPLRSTGQVGVMPEVTHDQMRGANGMRKGGKYGIRRLFASRCPDCLHDQVAVMPMDDPTGEWDLFDLEPRDYGDDGSTDDATDQGVLDVEVARPRPEPAPEPQALTAAEAIAQARAAIRATKEKK